MGFYIIFIILWVYYISGDKRSITYGPVCFGKVMFWRFGVCWLGERGGFGLGGATGGVRGGVAGRWVVLTVVRGQGGVDGIGGLLVGGWRVVGLDRGGGEGGGEGEMEGCWEEGWAGCVGGGWRVVW
jgi:hypothetical protein